MVLSIRHGLCKMLGMLPVLYSFRRCPYAIRARMAIQYAGVPVELREIVFRDKPESMLQASPKGTVPTLVLPDQSVLDESEHVMRWALQKNDPDNWLSSKLDEHIRELVDDNDFSFKQHLDHYKYADRYPEHTEQEYRQRGEVFLQKLDNKLQSNTSSHTPYLLGDTISFADVAIFPFIRQFAFVDKSWFDQSPYPNLREWLNRFLECDLFKKVMFKYPVWKSGDDLTVFPEFA